MLTTDEKKEKWYFDAITATAFALAGLAILIVACEGLYRLLPFVGINEDLRTSVILLPISGGCILMAACACGVRQIHEVALTPNHENQSGMFSALVVMGLVAGVIPSLAAVYVLETGKDALLFTASTALMGYLFALSTLNFGWTRVGKLVFLVCFGRAYVSARS